MAAEYEHDWEDPRLAVEGFVTDYIIWRLAKDNLEWHEAPDVPEGANSEHLAMRRVCEIFEERREKELLELNEELGTDELHFAKYREVVREFCTNDIDIQDEMTYGKMVGLIAFAGVLCVDKARRGRKRDIGLIALYTSKNIDAGIKLTWIESNRNWDGFMQMTVQIMTRHPRSSISNRTPPSSVPPPPKSRRSSLLFVAAGVSIVGALVAHRVFVRSH